MGRTKKGFKMQLKHKETGEIYTITGGKLLSKEEALQKDITASFVSLKSENEEIGVVIGYTKEGEISPANKFELISEVKEVTGG